MIYVMQQCSLSIEYIMDKDVYSNTFNKIMNIIQIIKNKNNDKLDVIYSKWIIFVFVSIGQQLSSNITCSANPLSHINYVSNSSFTPNVLNVM